MATQERAVFKPECEICKSPVASKRFFEWWRDCTCKGGKRLRDRRNEDEHQERQARNNKLKATDLEARELAQKEKTMERRETRQDAADDDGGQVEDVGEPLAAFEMPMDGSDLDLAPTAMLQRKDGATLLYDGKLNFLFGVPGSGKSFVALYAVHETLLRGRRAIYWDHEDTPHPQKALFAPGP